MPIQNHRHKLIDRNRKNFVPRERELTVDKYDLYVGDGITQGGKRVFANSKQNIFEIKNVSIPIGTWIKGDFSEGNASDEINANIIGVVIDHITDGVLVQTSGLYYIIDAPGSLGDILYLNDNGSISTQSGTVVKQVGIRTEHGIIISISGNKLPDSIGIFLDILTDKTKFIEKLIEFGILEGGGDMGAVLHPDLLIPSLIHSTVFEETPGGGVVAGIKETRIEILDTVNQGDPITLIPGIVSPNYTVEGDIPNLCDTSELFDASDKIRVVFDGLEIEPGVDIFRESINQVSFNDTCVAGVKIFIFS